MSEVIQTSNPLSPDTTKDSPEFGLKLLKAAVVKWNNGYNGESRKARKDRFDYNRSFGLGKQPMQEYKDILDLDGEMSVVNLPYDPIKVQIPYLNRLKDRYNQRDEKIDCTAVDPFTQSKKKRVKDEAIFKLKQKDNIQGIQQQAGLPLEEFSDTDPKSEGEIDIEFGFNYKERSEMVMENLINIVLYENDWQGVIKDRLLDDLIYCGYAGTKVYIDGTGRIKIRFIKPENLITSYTEWNDFRDWQYIGEIYYMSIMEVRLKYPGKINEEKLFQLSKTFVNQYGNPTTNEYSWKPMYATSLARPYDSWKVPVVELSFKTLYNLKYQSKTDNFGKEVLDRLFKPKIDVKIVESNPYYVEYTGAYIMDTEHLLEWGLSKNMIKPEENLQEIVSPFTVYMYSNTEMSNTPLMEMMIPTIKEMQLYKLQQLKIIAAAAPDGYEVDIATMSDVDLGGGRGNLTPLQLYEIWKQTGIKYYKSIPDEGMDGGQRRAPIQPTMVPFSQKLQQLQELYNAGLLTITNIISNQLDAGNITNQAVGAQVLQEAKQTGESTSNFIYNAFLNIMQRTAKVVQLRGWDILMYGKKWGVQSYKGYKQALDNNKIEYLVQEATDDWEKTSFDTQLKVVLDDKAAANLELNIQNCLTQQTITFADAIDIRNLAATNVKYASYIMAQRLDKRKKETQENALILSQQNEKATVSAATAKTEGELALEQAKGANRQVEAQATKDNSLILENQKSFNGLKEIIVNAILAKTGNIADIPSWVFEGVPMDKIVDHTIAMQWLQTIQQQQQAEQQQAQAQQAQQDSQQQQQGMPPEQDPTQPNQQQTAA